MAIMRLTRKGDLFVGNGDVAIITGIAFIRQNLSQRFKFFLGEWFLDLREGVPWKRDVFKRNPNLTAIRSTFRDIIMDTPGIVSIRRFDLRFDAKARRLHFDFECVCAQSELLVVRPEDRDFIISPLAEAA